MFLEQVSVDGTSDERGASMAHVDVVRDWLSTRPDALFDELRQRAPTFRLGTLAFVTRYEDVIDVLSRDDIFSVKPYADAITRINRGSAFLLGLDDGPEYREQLAWLRQVFPRDDMPRVIEVVSARSDAVIAGARNTGRLDLADGFGRLVPTLFAADYFGVPGPDTETLMQWARAIFLDAFANVLGLPLMSRRAMRASGAFRSHLDDLIAHARSARAADSPQDADVIGRLVTLQGAGGDGPSDAHIRDLLLWTTAGMIDNVNAAVCNATDYLLDHLEALQGAKAAAMSGDAARLWQHLEEALRFRTPTPVVTRLSVASHVLSEGTRQAETIAPGTLVFAGVGAAMMDDTVLDAPREFRLDRPAGHYLHFGAGLHHCLGVHIAQALVTTMVGRVLALPGLRRARGPSGRLPKVGLYPRRLVVEFDRQGA